jgi:uncharacterized damage-inducible protein DinB
MFRDTQDFLNTWQHETENTVKLLQNVSPEALNQSVTGYDRTIGELGWHLVESIDFMAQQAALNTKCPISKDEALKDPNKLAEAYRNTANQLAEAVKDNWKTENLGEKVNVWGMEWQKGGLLAAFNAHQTHHRGQMTVLMRQTGCAPCGIYGPSKEEWAAMQQN